MAINYTVQHVTSAGTVVNYALDTPSGTNDLASIGSGHNTFLHMKNTNGATRTVTVTHQGTTAYGQALPDAVYTIAATTGELMVPLYQGFDNGTGNAVVSITPAVTGVTAALIRTDF